MKDISNTYTNQPIKGLVTDLDDALVSNEFWTFLRNGTINSHKGNIQFVQNEPSTLRCLDLPYTPIGFIKILNNRWVVFSTNNVVSEIGIFDESKCTYTKVVSSPCLNFNTSNLIRGTFKESFDCGEVIYWTDGVNPRRRLNLNDIPYTYTLEDDACQTKVFTDQLDCEALLISPNVQVPKINVSLGLTGTLQNGSYQVGIAYTVNKERVTNYYSISLPQSVWSHNQAGRSINVDITGLDRDFDQYELVLVYTVKNTTTAKSIGFFPTSVARHEISNADIPEYITIPLSEVVLDRPYYFTADDVVSNDQYLLWSGVKSRPELNYQPQAFNIKTKWVLYQVLSSYYEKGGKNRGYYRDEVYSFGIQWLFKNGEWSNVYHIPGREASGQDTKPAVGKDVFEKAEDGPMPRGFEIYDTSKNKRRVNFNSNKVERAIMEGDMGYWESTRLYPDNELMFGEARCTPIRHHKFPSECNAPRYQKGGDYINILGVKFENIEHPKDANGKEVSDVVGYRIVRGDRNGNRSIIARGIFSNVRSYNETISQGGINEEVLYPNYPFNDLRADSFISSRQTYNRSGERDFIGLNVVKHDQFNFYSPATLIGNVALGDQVMFDTEETADVSGRFTNVYNHPRAKVLKNSVFWLAIAVGAIDGVLSVFGRRCVTSIQDGILNVTATGPTGVGNVTYAAAGLRWVQECETLVEGLRTRDILKLRPVEAIAKLALKTLQTAAKAGMGVYFAFKTANELIATIKAFQPFQDYAMQYNGHALFNNYSCVTDGNRRRHIDYYQHLYDGINVVEGVKFNNSKRERSTYIRVGSPVIPPKTTDNSRKTITEANICDNPYKAFKSKASMFYGTVKRRVPDQYGQLESVMYMDTGYLVNSLPITPIGEPRVYKTETVFGGDAFVNKFAVNRTHQFFRQNLANANFPDGTEYDYSLYRNVGFPRYWLNTQDYDVSELITVGRIPNRLPANRYNLDCSKSQGSNRSLNLKNVEGKFYLASNGVVEFFVESDYNLDYRDYTTQLPNFYSDKFNDLDSLFRSDRWEDKEEFIYDESLSKELKENALFQQRVDFDPTVDEKCFAYYKNRVIYSQPAFREQRGDNWLIYLANNYYDFTLSDYGNLTSMQAIDNQQIMFLFDKSSPYVTIGRDELQTENGVKVTIGDAGLFARQPRPILYTDYAYASSQSKWAFVNTQYGSFYPSQRQGRLFNYRGQLDELSRQGLHYWFKEYLPSKLLKDFPDFKGADNPLSGVGLLSVFDNTDERYYLSKKDYALKEEYKGKVTYNPATNQFKFGASTIALTDTNFFDDASFTISYSPKDQAFISWHDWHPDWFIQGENHFMSVKGKTIWKHNQRCDSFCNFYDIDYPFQLEYVINNGQNVQVLRNVEYVLEVGKYFNQCQDFHHILDENFDVAIVHNSEQISGLLRLILASKNSMQDAYDYPKLGVEEFLIKYDKEENKYSFNQFDDIVRDRGEFTKRNYPLWRTSPNGYIKSMVEQSIDYTKSDYQKKKFRHMQHRVFLSKEVCADKKMIFKIANAHQYPSFR